MPVHHNKQPDLIPLLIGSVLFVYLVLRVFLMPITIDEYTSINVHASMSWWDILTTGQPNPVWAPNNHVLNTLFIKLEWWIFGKRDWALRLHILLAFVVCYYYASKIIERITSSQIRQGLYLIILFVNPYLLDFFGIARGYALSIAAFTAAFYYFILYTGDFSIRNLRATFFALFLAVWSNFSALYILALMVDLFCIEALSNRNKINIKKHLLEILIACCAIAIVIITPLIKTIRSGESTGGKTGLFQDTIVTYINQYIHFNPYLNRHGVFSSGWKYIEVAGIVLLGLWIVLQLAGKFFKSDIRLTKLQFVCLFLVIGVALISKFLFVFFQIPLPAERTVLLYSIPFYIGICVAFEIIIRRISIVVIPVWVIALFLCWHTISSFSFDRTFEWWQTGDAKRVVRYLEEDLKNIRNKDPKLIIGIESWQYPSLAFYTEEDFKDVLITQWTDLSEDKHFDYLFVSAEKTNKVWSDYEPVKIFKYGTLYKPRLDKNPE
jgi:hypothetical protein